MKCLIVLAIFCGAINYSQQALSKEQVDEMVQKLLTDCSAKEGASAADVESVRVHADPTTMPAKCLHACIGESLDLLVDGKTNIQASTELAKMAFGADDPKVAIAEKIATECHEVTAPERCEAAVASYRCSVEAAKKHGIELKDLHL